MGNTSSEPDFFIGEINQTAKEKHKKVYYESIYNLVPSFPNITTQTITKDNINRLLGEKIEAKPDLAPKYIDLRPEMPPVLDMKNIPLHPICSVATMLHYSLLKQNLPIFPPSRIFIFKNFEYYEDLKGILTLENIFQAVKTYGFCSENDLPYSEDLIYNDISKKDNLYEKAEAFKYIETYRVENNLEIIKTILENRYPILVGVSVYQDMNRIVSTMTLPEKDDICLGGISLVLVGFSEERKSFLAMASMGRDFASSGYILIPYEYILDPLLCFERYIVTFNRHRVEGFINQRKRLVTLDKKPVKKEEYSKDEFKQSFSGNIFG